MPISYDEYKKKYKKQIEKRNQQRIDELSIDYAPIKTTSKKDDDKKWYEKLLSGGAYIAKELGTGALGGITGLGEAGTTEMANNFKKGEDKNALTAGLDFLKSVNDWRNPVQELGKNAVKSIIKNAKDEDATLKQKIVNTALDIASPETPVDKALQTYGSILPDKSSEKVMDFGKTISKPYYDAREALNKEKSQYGTGMQVAGTVSEVVGRMLPSIGATVATRNPSVGLATMGISTKGTATTEALRKGADLEQAVKIGDLKGQIEVGTEMLTGGLSVFGKGSLDDLAEKGIAKVTERLAAKGLDKAAKYTGKALNEVYSIVGEVAEETISDVLGTTIDSATVDPDASYGLDEWGETALVTVLSTIALNILTRGKAGAISVEQQQQTAIEKAEQKLGRKLTDEEKGQLETYISSASQESVQNKQVSEPITQQPINTELTVQDIDNQIMALEGQLNGDISDAEYERISNEIRVLEERANQLEQAPVQQNVSNTQLNTENAQKTENIAQNVQANKKYKIEDNQELYNKAKDTKQIIHMTDNIQGILDSGYITGNLQVQEKGKRPVMYGYEGFVLKPEALDYSESLYNGDRGNDVTGENIKEKTADLNEFIDKAGVKHLHSTSVVNGMPLSENVAGIITYEGSENYDRLAALAEEKDIPITVYKKQGNGKATPKEINYSNKTFASENIAPLKANNNLKPLEQRVFGDDLLDAQDFIEEVKSVGANVDENGYVTVYHQTSNENAQKIKESGKLISKELDVFFSTSKDAQQAEGKGQTKLEFKIPAEKLVLDDIFTDNADVKIPLNGEKSIDVSEYLVTEPKTQENDIAPIKQELADLTNELKDTIKNTKKEIKSLKTQLNDVISDLKENPAPISPKLAEAEVEGNLQSYVDNDSLAPEVKEDTTPDYEYENDNKGTQSTVESPFENRDYKEVGKRDVKAYQYEHPEVKPYFQPEAAMMLGELESTVKGERFIVGDISQAGSGNYEYSGTTRHTTDSIAQLLDGVDGKNKLSYEDIRKGLQAIIKDEGAENNAASKRIEFILNDRLMNGYTTIDGYEVPANQGYIDTIDGIKTSDDFSDVPIEENPDYYDNGDSNTEYTEENIPIRSNVDWNSVEDTSRSSQQNLNLNNLGETLLPSKADFNSIEDTSKGKQVTYNEETQQFEEEDLVKKTKKELRRELLGTEAQKEFITSALDNAKNRSMALMNNTDTIRNTELVFGRDAANVINEKIFQKEIDNEADSIKWQNEQRQAIKDLGIKARSKESAAVQKYGEKQWVNDAGEVLAYGDAELANEFSDVATQEKIKNAAKEIRNKYDDYIDRANEVLTKLGFDPIKKRKDYMRHFQELTDVFSRHGIPFNAQNMAEHTLPTDINGLTEFWSPQKNYFANMQARKGLKTTYDAITGIDGYISGISNLIFHTEDIQRGRAFEELIRETYGEDKGWDNLENLPDELKQARSEKIQDNHLSNYAAWVHEWTNNVAGKKSKIDRSVEAMFGRKAFAFLDQTRKQVGSNMIGLNLSSSLTNLIAPVQAAAKTNKLALAKGTADTIKNIFIKDSFMEKNKFLTSRMGTDMISKNAWQKIQDAGYVFMKGMDWFSSNQIVRSKYYELRAKGMSEQQAHTEAGKFAARILGDRTKGANPQLYNSKLVGLVTQFQLEVNNQLYSQFYDTYHESKEAAQGNALKTAAGMTFTLGQLFAFTHLFGQTFEAIAGYNPTFDVINMLATAFGWGDDEDEEKTTSERLKEAADQLVDALPYVNILTGGGRIPIASAIPNLVGVATGGKDEYGNELKLEDELKKLLYLIPPTGGNQVKKTTQGLSMFDDDLPVTGSYTDSGNLRFPVEETPANVLQAALFGQWANKNAGQYFDEERAPLKSKQIQEYADLDMPIADYWEYRDGLKEQNTIQDKFDYINSLDVTDEQKNIMINNAVDRKEAIDLSNYDDFGSYDEFDYATKNPDKYRVIEQIDTYDNYVSYKEDIVSIKEQFSTDNGYSTEQRKAAVQQYIQSLSLSVPQKIMLEKMAGGYSVKSYRSYLQQYIESLPLTAEEKQAIDDQLFN